MCFSRGTSPQYGTLIIQDVGVDVKVDEEAWHRPKAI
jgi:hypothetical protein